MIEMILRILGNVDIEYFTIAGFWDVRKTKETLPKFLYGWSILMLIYGYRVSE